MGKPLLADYGISISELKKNPSAAIRAADGAPVAILNRNTPEAYLVPAEAWEEIMDALDDMELARIVGERQEQERIRVNIDDL